MAFQGKQAAMPVHEYKAVRFELDAADETTGEFSGYAAVFGNIDGGRDIIERGAFTKTIAEDFDRIKIMSQHNVDDLPVGKPIELREDEKGLYIRGKISDTQKGRDIKTLLKDGVLCELSIGYDAVDFDYDGTQHIRRLKEVKLWEISIVTWAMNEQARIDEVKSMVEGIRTEAKSGKISKARLDALKPFIAVVRELADILGPFLDPPTEPEDTVATQPSIKKAAQNSGKQTKTAGIVFEIVPTPNRR